MERDIEQVKTELIEYYVEKKRIANPQYQYVSSPRYDKLFEKMAKICIDNDLPADGYIQAAWNDAPNKMKFSPDNITLVAHGKNPANKMATVDEESFAGMIANQLEIVSNYVIKSGWSEREVLLYPENGLYGWFRIIASNKNDQEILDKYREIARLECTPELKKFLDSKGYDTERLFFK